MNHNQAHRLKRTTAATVTLAAGVAGLSFLRGESGDGHLNAKPGVTHVISGIPPQEGNVSAYSAAAVTDTEKLDRSKHPILRIKIDTGADAPVSEALTAIAKAEGLRTDAIGVKEGIAADERVINEALTGYAEDGNDVQATDGDGLAVIAARPIVDPAAIGLEDHEDHKYVQISLQQ